MTVLNTALLTRAIANARRLVHRICTALEPDYDWGPYGWERLDGEGEGEARSLQVEWLGIKISIAVGRRPNKDAANWLGQERPKW